MNQDQRETAIETIRIQGTMKAGAEAAGVSVRTLNEEMRKSAIFRRHILEAREEGKMNIADQNLQRVQDIAEGKLEVKMPQLTANLSILNWVLPGFRGKTEVSGRIAHDVRVITAVPRPKYDIEISKVKALDKPPKKVVKSKKEIRDKQGNLIAVQSVEEAIEEA